MMPYFCRLGPGCYLIDFVDMSGTSYEKETRRLVEVAGFQIVVLVKKI